MLKKLSFCFLLGLASTVAHAKAYIFATEATYPPFVFQTANGHIQGFETELIQAICQEAGLQCQFKHQAWDSLIIGLNRHQFDAIYGGFAITSERAKQVLFTDPLYTNEVGFVFFENHIVPLSEMGLRNQRIGVQRGSLFEAYLRQHYPKSVVIKGYASIQDALLDLKATRLDGVFGDVPVLKEWIERQAQNQFVLSPVTTAEEIFAQGCAVGLRKEDMALKQQLDAALKRLQDSGRYQALKEKYLAS